MNRQNVDPPVGQPTTDQSHPSVPVPADLTRTWEVVVPAPELPLVRKRATGKLTKPNVWLNSNMRLHRLQEAKLTALWREAGRLAAAGLVPVGAAHIVAHVWKPRGGRYDAGNLYPTAKAVVDGIVDAGILEDDSNAFLLGPDMRHGGIGPAGLVLTVTEITL